VFSLRCIPETTESLSSISSISQSPLFLTVTETCAFSPMWQSLGKVFEIIRFHFFPTFMVLEPIYSYSLSFVSTHVIFAVILYSVSSHGAGASSVMFTGSSVASLGTLVSVYSVSPLINSIPTVSTVSTTSLASASPLFVAVNDKSILSQGSYVSSSVSTFMSKLGSPLTEIFNSAKGFLFSVLNSFSPLVIVS